MVFFWELVYRLYHGILYFQNLIQLHSTCQKKSTDFPCQLSQNTNMFNNITCRPLKPNFTETGQKILEVHEEINLSL